MYADQRREAVEQLVSESLTAADPAAILDAARAAHTAQGEDGKEQFDALAYTEALRARLIEAQPLGEAELAALAAARAENVRQAILDSNAELDSRIAVNEPAAVDVDDNERVRMKLTLGGQ